MNLNKKIAKFTGDGIEEYNLKFNELIDTVNWLAGMRTINGRQIAESDQGPVIDLSQVASTQSGGNPWAIDPDGFRAGWSKVLVMDPNYAQSGNGFVLWFWASPNAFTSPLPFLTDPDGTPAQWVQHQVCVDGNVVNKWFWGTP